MMASLLSLPCFLPLKLHLVTQLYCYCSQMMYTVILSDLSKVILSNRHLTHSIPNHIIWVELYVFLGNAIYPFKYDLILTA